MAESADSPSLQTEVGNTSTLENTEIDTYFEHQSHSYVSDSRSYELEAPKFSRQPVMVHFHDLKPDVLLGPGWSCIGSRRFGGRCRVRIPKRILQLAAQEIIRLRTNISKKPPSEAELVEVAKPLLCKSLHQQYQTAEIVKSWSEELSVPSSNVSFLDKKTSSEKAFTATTDSRPISSGDNFLQFRILSPKSIISALVKRMREPLAVGDESDGSIYMFTRPGTPSMIKIGSTRDVPRILQGYAMNCNYKPNLISHQFVHRRRRTESLIHISLREQRRKEQICNSGKGCRSSHIEWFEIDYKLALLSVQRWTEWMNLNPYISSRLDAFWEANLFEGEQLQSLNAFNQWIEQMTQRCIENGENSWRGRTDGRFWNCDEFVGDEAKLSPVSLGLSLGSADVPTLVSGTTLSTTSSNERIPDAVEEFATLLLKDEVLQRLQVIAFERTGVKKFERNFRRLLEIYSKNLKAEARTSFEIEAVRFVQTRAPNIANCIRSRIEPAREHKYKEFDALSIQEPERAELIERYLEGSTVEEMDTLGPNLETYQSPAISVTTKDQNSDYSELSDGELGDNGTEPSDIELDEADILSLPNLGEVKEFLITSEAFGKLRENLRDFVFPLGQRVPEGLVRIETKNSANLNSVEENFFNLKSGHVGTDVNIVSIASDVADANTDPSSTLKKENPVELNDHAAIQDINLFDSISETSTASSAPKFDLCGVHESATATSRRGEGLIVTGTPFWKYKEFMKFSALQRWTRARWNQTLRPRVQPGFIRIEWTCDCGEVLYGDFSNSNPQAVNRLAEVLQGSTSNELSSSGIQSSNQGGLENFPPSTLIPAQSTSGKSNSSATNSKDSQIPPPATSTALAATISDPQYVALCVNTGEFQKTLAEVEVSDVASDAELFERLKSGYCNQRGFRARFFFLIQPVAIRFFNLFDLRGGHVDLSDMGNWCSIPPADVREYRYRPIPLEDLPPIPSNIFVHFLKYGNRKGVHQKKFWVNRLPKRLKERIIDVPDIPVWGWGIYVIEGPNKLVIFWITVGTMFASILASILWSSLRGDIQGGMGLGSMIIAMTPVIMAAFLFKLTTE